MSKIVLFDPSETRKKLLPLTYTRPLCDIRIGMMTIREKWQNAGFDVQVKSEAYLNDPFEFKDSSPALFMNASVCPNEELIARVKELGQTESIKADGEILAFNGTLEDFQNENYLTFKSYKYVGQEILKVNQCSDIFNKNEQAIKEDFKVLTDSKESQSIDSSCQVIGNNLFVGQDVKANAVIFNTETGPIFLDDGAEVMEGSMLRGPIYIGKNATVKMGAKIYGPTTIGPYCKVGGEIGNSVLFGFSNKGHDGYMGNSILGEWCNLGADTNTSNLKNNYSSVKTWSYVGEKLEDTGLTFHGLVMGDHSKCGINTMFNTGTTVGVSANIFGGNFPDKFVPSYSWGGADGFSVYELEKAIETAKAVYARRKKDLTDREQNILRHIFSITSKYRT